MNERVFILREAVVKITQMLSGKGIKVTQRGVSAYVKTDPRGKPIQVNLPYLPDNATEELCMAIQGFLDHEVAHILFTDFSVKAKTDQLHSMTNIIEDTRIEREMAKRFSGSSYNLSVTGKFFVDKYTTPMMQEAAAKGDAQAVIGVLMVPLIRAMAGQHVFKDFMGDKMHIVQAVYDRIADLEPQIQTVNSTAGCLALAEEIERRLKSEGGGKGSQSKNKNEDGGEGEEEEIEAKDSGSKPKDKKKDEKKKKAKSGKKDESEKDENKGKKPEPGEKGKDEPKKEEGEPDPEKDEKGPKGEDEKGKPDPKSEGEGDDGEDEGEDEGKDAGGEDEDGDENGEGAAEGEEDEGEGNGDDSESKTDADGDGEIGESCEAVWDEIDKDGANDFDKAMSRVISDATATTASHAEYLVYTKDEDLVEPLHVGSGYRSEMLKDLEDKVDHMVGPLQKDLERAIAARSLAVWENGRRSGRLAASNLSRLAVGDTRVFRRKHESTSKDVAVELVVDASGSMSGTKVHLATQAAYALSSVLERIGIKHEVICFTTGNPPGDLHNLQAEEAKLGREFTRVESLYMPVLKSFNERLSTAVKERFGWLPNSGILRNNIDGECIEVVARRLMARREAGKVMIVLSDGRPNARGDSYALSRHLKQVVKNVGKAGVNVVGIGIMTDSVQQYYPKNVVIHDVNELPDRVIKELRHLLIQ